MAKTKRLTTSSIKIVIHPIWPRKKDKTFRNVLYIREKVRQMFPLLHENAEYTSFWEIVNDCILIYGIDNDIELYDDLANKFAKDLWLGVLRDSMDDPDSISTFSQYRNLISENAKGFVYELAIDDKGKLNGIVVMIITDR